MTRKRRPRLKGPTAEITTKYPVAMFDHIRALADSRRVYASQIIRDAVAAYLAQQRADQPGAAVAPTPTTDSAPVEGAESRESEVLSITCD